MLNDPIVVNYGLTTSPTGGVASNFRRTSVGKYTSVDGSFTPDQPARMSILPRWKKEGNSSYSASLEVDKNVSPINGIQQQDDTLSVKMIVSGNLRSFTVVDFVNAMNALAYYFIVNFPRIVSGES